MDLEKALMARVQEGDEQALTELYDRLASQVYALALRMLESHEEAEEVLQDTFLKLYRTRGSYQPELSSPRTYIYTITRNKALSRLRARKSRPTQAHGWDVHDPANTLAGSENPDPLTHMVVKHALANLDAEDAKLLQLAFFKGYSHAQLAELTGLPLGTVKSKVRRALLQLRNHLEGQDAS